MYVPLNVVIISNYLDKYNEQQTISCTSMASFVVQVVPVTDDLCAVIGYQLWLYYLQILFVNTLCHDHKTRKRSRDHRRVPLFMDNIINTTTRHNSRSPPYLGNDTTNLSSCRYTYQAFAVCSETNLVHQSDIFYKVYPFVCMAYKCCRDKQPQCFPSLPLPLLNTYQLESRRIHPLHRYTQ